MCSKRHRSSNRDTVEETFKCDFYYDVSDAIKDSPVTILLGPRKCGKTFCLMQLVDDLSNAEYIDIKKLSEEQQLDLIEKICDDMDNNVSKVYLVLHPRRN